MLIRSWAFRREKLFVFGQDASKIISFFHENTIWLPFNILGDKLRLLWCVAFHWRKSCTFVLNEWALKFRAKINEWVVITHDIRDN